MCVCAHESTPSNYATPFRAEVPDLHQPHDRVEPIEGMRQADSPDDCGRTGMAEIAKIVFQRTSTEQSTG